MTKTILAEVAGWTPLIDHLVQKYGLTTAAVWGRMWRYTNMRDNVCRASITTIGDELGLARSTVRLSIKRLCEDGYIRDLTPKAGFSPHVYIDTGKVQLISSTIAFEKDIPLRNSEGSDLESDSPLRPSEAPLRKSEAKKVLRESIREELKDKTHTTETNNGKSALDKPIAEGRLSPNRIWDAILGQLKCEMPKAAFDTFVIDSHVLAWDSEIALLIIEAKSEYACDWITARLSSTVQRMAIGLANQSLTIHFVAPELA